MDKKYDICHISRLRMGIDGEGIRELILTAGCPLRCKYCINPFTWDGDAHIEQLSAQEIYDRIKLDRPYILATNGGITIGGGEPLLQPELFRDMREVCEPAMTIYVETSLNVPWKNVETASEYIDCFYIDIKAISADVYGKYTSGKLDTVLDNISKLVSRVGSNKAVIRIPIIPEYTNKNDQHRAVETLKEMGIQKFDLFKYRKTIE